jgi:REP element-mobilizing transposase RayT
MKPKKGSKRLRKGRASIENQHYLITTTVLDRKPILNKKEPAEIIFNSLQWLEKQGSILLDAAVVMPDHLHLVVGLRQDSLGKMMQSFKGYTAYEINKLLKMKGAFWQPQYHDHAVRQDEDLKEIILYTLKNPVRAGLVKDFHEYPFWLCRWSV